VLALLEECNSQRSGTPVSYIAKIVTCISQITTYKAHHPHPLWDTLLEELQNSKVMLERNDASLQPIMVQRAAVLGRMRGIGSTPLASLTDDLGNYDYMFLKDFNNFYHPMAGQAYYDKDYEFEIALQIVAKKFPEHPLASQAETFAALKKSMGIHNSAFHSLDISPEQYRRHKFIVGLDCEKVLGASFSGENLKNGSLLTLMMKNIGVNSANYPTSITVVLHADCILNIRDTGVEVLD
jgi:hypothetical protein